MMTIVDPLSSSLAGFFWLSIPVRAVTADQNSRGTLVKKLNIDSSTRQQREAMSAVRGALHNLLATAEPLLGSNFTAASTKPVAIVSNPAVLTAVAGSSAQSAEHIIGIYQLATAQQNMGSLLLTAGLDFSAGLTSPIVYSQKIQPLSGSSAVVSVTVNPGDTNEAVMKNLAHGVSASGAGVDAQVYTAATMDGTEYSMMVLTGLETGIDNAFSVSDVGGSLVTALGIGHATTISHNSSYSVDGTSINSSSNQVTLDNENVIMTLQKISLFPVYLTVYPRGDNLPQAMGSFINSYNAVVNNLRKYAGYVDPRALSRFTDFALGNLAGLASVGISDLNGDNFLYDPALFHRALQQDSSDVYEKIGGSGGLVSNAVHAAQMAMFPTDSDLWRINYNLNKMGMESKSLTIRQFRMFTELTLLESLNQLSDVSEVNVAG